MIDVKNYRLPETLPGREAHLTMAPQTDTRRAIEEQRAPADARGSAVLVLYNPNDQSVLLMKRNSYPGIHSNQISFPGGKCEEVDRDYFDTACREAFEELGIRREDIKIVGTLTRLYVPPSNFMIYPVLAFDIGVGPLKADPREVSHYMRVPLSDLNPKEAKQYQVKSASNTIIEAPGFMVGDTVLWGATAMILAELYQLLKAAE